MTRESDLYKDKIEVSLDGRQIFYLFFGGAVIVGLVFVLGVMVGRRVEARAHVDPAHTQTAADPLAALDRLEARGMTFQSTLTGSAAPTEVEHAVADLEKARKAQAKKPDAKKDAAKPEPKVEPKPEPKLEAKVEPKVEAKVEPKVAAKVEPKPEAKADAKPDAKLDKPDAKSDKKADAAKPKKHDDDKAKFTLQLSSFQDKGEADAFLQTIKAAGYQPYVTEAAVDGKGTFYRVRLGSYRTLEAANNAKSELDPHLKKPAQVTKL